MMKTVLRKHCTGTCLEKLERQDQRGRDYPEINGEMKTAKTIMGWIRKKRKEKAQVQGTRQRMDALNRPLWITGQDVSGQAQGVGKAQWSATSKAKLRL